MFATRRQIGSFGVKGLLAAALSAALTLPVPAADADTAKQKSCQQYWASELKECFKADFARFRCEGETNARFDACIATGKWDRTAKP